MCTAIEHVDWTAWLQRWDAQQEGYVAQREARFTALFDVLEALLPPSFTALDLACGPGSLSARLLDRFPEARAVAVDIDPMMVALGRGALRDVGGRLRWVEADLADPGWAASIADVEFDAVVSSTALHWLPAGPLTRLYADVGRMLRPGGVLLDADTIEPGPSSPTLAALSERFHDRFWSDEAFAERGVETAEQWWEAAAAEPAFAPLLAEREQRFAGKERHVPPDLDTHVAALRAAGFREVDTVWQALSDRVLMAVR